MIEKHGAFRILMLITTPKKADKATKVLSREGVMIENRLPAVGTATSQIMDILGLGSIDKTILITMMPREIAHDLLKKLGKELKLGSTNSGIAFTIPLTGMSNAMLQMLQKTENSQQRKEKTTMSELKYSFIAVNINRGYSNDVMDAAREAGASGGSVVNSRLIANPDVCHKWGVDVQEEKEIVIIVANAENKLDIMKKITEKCGIHSEAKGMVFSVPIDEVEGLE